MKSMICIFVLMLFLCLQSQSIKDSMNSADILVIAHDDQAETMNVYKEWRESQGYKVEIVTTTQIYKEFASTLPYKSIKNCIDYALDEWQKPPRYVLLAGGYGKVPSYPVERSGFEEYGPALTDNCYVLDESRKPNHLRIPIGRMPTETPEQLLNVLNKTMYVEEKSFRELYGLDFLFLADNGDPSHRITLFEEMTASLVEGLPEGQNWARVDVDSASSFFGTKQDFIDRLNQKPLVVNFFGLGAEHLWMHERMLTLDDVNLVNNVNTPFFMVLLTCDALVSDSPDSVIVNRLMWQEDKGAFAAIAPSHLMYASEEGKFAQEFYQELFQHNPARLGDAFVTAINQTTKPIAGYSDFLLNFTIIGDPVLILPIRTVAATDFQDDSIPSTFELKQNFPNPFNPQTTIEFSLPSARIVNLAVYNLLGQPVADLVEHQLMPAGKHSIIFEAGDMPSGSYLYSIEAGELRLARRMVILK